MTKADQAIKAINWAAVQHQERTGCDGFMRLAFHVGRLEAELRAVYQLLEIASNPPGCTEVESDGVRYGLKWNKDGEFWEIFIGGQCVNVALSGGLIDELCDEAERIALDGEAA